MAIFEDYLCLFVSEGTTVGTYTVDDGASGETIQYAVTGTGRVK